MTHQVMIHLSLLLLFISSIFSFYRHSIPNLSSQFRLPGRNDLSAREIEEFQRNKGQKSNEASPGATTSPTTKSVKRIRPQGITRDKDINNPNRLKIIGGTVKGTKLQSPDVYLRPMMAKVREALFSTLTFMDVFAGDSTRVLDMFSGSGSVGLEALSRGAVHTTFVDLSKDCTECSLQNAEKCGFKDKVTAVCARAEDVLQNPAKFGLNQPYNLISITPPYLEVSYEELIRSVSNSPLVKEDTIVILEYPTEMGNLPHILETDRLYGIRNRRYGRTILGIYVFRPSQIYDMKIDEFASNSL